MIWMVYGSGGWIGSKVVSLIKSLGDQHEVIEAKARADDYQACLDEITHFKPDRVIATIGRTSGPGCQNIDYLEQPGKIVENLRDNLHGPINLADICHSLGIHFTYLGTGCIYEYDESHRSSPDESGRMLGFSEDDKPNFAGSQYSAVKGVTDQLIRRFNTSLNVRIRMPISDDVNPRNFITKITRYSRVISIPNSMTVLTELMPIMIDMSLKKITGTVNLTNPGVITHGEILSMYQQIVDPTFTYQIMDQSELSSHTVARRSNNYLETSVLEKLYPHVTPIHEAVKACLIRMKQSLA